MLSVLCDVEGPTGVEKHVIVVVRGAAVAAAAVVVQWRWYSGSGLVAIVAM